MFNKTTMRPLTKVAFLAGILFTICLIVLFNKVRNSQQRKRVTAEDRAFWSDGFQGSEEETRTFDVGKELRLIVEASGEYTLAVGTTKWLQSGPIFFTVNGTKYSASDGSLQLTGFTRESGQDLLGEWNLIVFYYQPRGMHCIIRAMIKSYTDTSTVLFAQHFVAKNDKAGRGSSQAVSSSFPSFQVSNSPEFQSLSFVGFGGIMCGDTLMKQGRWILSGISSIVSGLNSGPLVLFDQHDRAMIITAFDNFLSSSVVYSSSVASWGLMDSIEKVPADFSMWTVLHFSSEGINKAFEEWGRIMRKRYDRSTAARDDDLTNNFLGYYTDKGSYYYYNTNEFKNYEDTLTGVLDHAKSRGIPYRYIQYDSWFYPQGEGGGILEWIAKNDIFPSGLSGAHSRIGLPVVAHSRHWSIDVRYAKSNQGRYDFIDDPGSKISLPKEQYFWDSLFAEASKWGLIVYEQDWLDYTFNKMRVTKTKLGAAKTWLQQMNRGALKYNMTLQYCRAPARFALQAVEIPAVSQARVTTDYRPGNENWRMGITSMLVHALGMAPYKDAFWTSKVQPGNPYHLNEKYPALHSLVATLSAGPVTPADKVGYEDVDLIMRTCNSEGRILKPSRPAMPVNKQLIQATFGSFTGQVWSTYSQIGQYRFVIVMGAGFSLSDSMTLNPSDLDLTDQETTFSVFTWNNTQSGREFSSSQPLEMRGCTEDKFCLYFIVPHLYIKNQKVLLLGELNKWVTMSPQRVTDINSLTDDIEVTLKGASKEKVTFTYFISEEIRSISCQLSTEGIAILNVRLGLCS